MYRSFLRICGARKHLSLVRSIFVVDRECEVTLRKHFFFMVKSTEKQGGSKPTTVERSTLIEQLRAEVVLGEDNRKSFVKNFKLYNGKRTVRPGESLDGATSEEKTSEAAILVPLCTYRGELGLLYTLRSSKMSMNRSQVSFPGGMREKTDRDLEETALRETWEELKIPREKIDVWSSGNMIGKKDINVLPVFAYIGEIDPAELRINRTEVEEAFVLTLEALCDSSSCRFTQFRDKYTLPTYLNDKHRVWGFTAAITHMAMNSLLPRIYHHKLLNLRPILSRVEANQPTNDPQPH